MMREPVQDRIDKESDTSSEALFILLWFSILFLHRPIVEAITGLVSYFFWIP